MRLFKKQPKKSEDKLEYLLDTISEMTRELDEESLAKLLEAIKGIFKVRKSLKEVKTNEEKENADIYEAEKVLEKESTK
jgi:acyl-[acyl carrier protein]--UDP-N-acetylglucosamine O-acyltransferase